MEGTVLHNKSNVIMEMVDRIGVDVKIVELRGLEIVKLECWMGQYHGEN